MAKTLRVAIIGSGRMASKHAQAWEKNSADIVAVTGQTESSVKSFSEKFAIPNYYTQMEEFLKKEKPDAVSITTPSHTHAELSIKCLNQGMHVLCEKPIALNTEDAKKLAETVEKTKKKFMTGFNWRFHDQFLRAKNLTDKIGEPKIAWFRGSGNIQQKPWYLDKKTSGMITYESSIHRIDWLRWMLNSEAKYVYSESLNDVDGTGLTSNEWIIVKFKNNALGIIGSSFTFPSLSEDIGIIGTKKCIGIRNGNIIVKPITEKINPKARLMQYLQVPNLLPDINLLLFNSSIKNEIKHFTDCILNDKTPSPSITDGIKSIEIAEAAIKSAKEGKRIYLE